MSDVPATAWWALSLMLVLSKQTALGALGSGLAAAMAILTRPNLVPLAAIIGIWLGLCVMATRGLDRRRQATRLGLFVCGVLPGCFAVAALNQYLYGSALRSGYAPLHALYAWSNAASNFDRYPRWLVETQTPFILVGLFSPLIAWRAWRAAPLMSRKLLMLFSFSAAV